MQIAIHHGRVIDPAQAVDTITSLYIRDQTIIAWGTAPTGFQATQVIDAHDCIVAPGFIDLGARLREPGAEHKGTIASETLAAASGGITTLCVPPDTNPVMDTTAVIELLKQRADQVGKAKVLPIAALTCGLRGEQLSNMAALKKAGCIGVSNGLHPILDTQVLRRAMEYAATHDLLVFLHPNDPYLSAGGCAHEGIVSSRLGLPAIPYAAETVAVARDLALIEHTGVRAHFCRLSSGRAVAMIAQAQQQGLPVTADVCVHQLHLTEQAIDGFEVQCHLIPPLRTDKDRQKLGLAVASGVITALCSDHQPHDDEAKKSPFPTAASGISAVETLLPLALQLVEQGILTLPQMISRLSRDPARILRLETGTLAVGSRADICIFDPQQRWQLTAKTMLSQGRNTPFLGKSLQGRVKYTLLEGKLVYADQTLA